MPPPPGSSRPGRAQIDHAPAGPQQVVLVVDLDQLIGGPRAVALALARPQHKRSLSCRSSQRWEEAVRCLAVFRRTLR